MKHHDRWDLPKGHVDPGETDMEAALRELEEETGFAEEELQIDPDFCYEERYMVPGKRYGAGGGTELEKTLQIYLASMNETRDPRLTEHLGFRWFLWKPPHNIQGKTIDPLLSQLRSHLQTMAESRKR